MKRCDNLAAEEAAKARELNERLRKERFRQINERARNDAREAQELTKH